MASKRQQFDSLLELLEQVKAKLELSHTPQRDYGTGVLLYKVEIHVIQHIGNNPHINSTDLTRHLGVTKGAVSQMVDKLLKKGLVQKVRSPADARQSNLELTELGWKAFHTHEQFHNKIYQAVQQHFGKSFESKLDSFEVVLTDFNEILTQYLQRKSRNKTNLPQ